MADLHKIGRYQIEAHLGSGAYADVYRATDTLLKRTVALKLLKPALLSDEDAFARFLQEAQVGASLIHPRIAWVWDLGEANGRHFIAMRYVDGQSLYQVIREKGCLGWDEAVRILEQVAEGLIFAHEKGLVHRDIKPQNILISSTEGAVLTDFGLVRAMEAGGTLTRTGAMLGTPLYMPPEIWKGEMATPAADQYAIGCVLVEMLTGACPFDAPTAPAIMLKHFSPLQLPAQWPKGVPVGLDGVLHKVLEKEPAARFANLKDFLSALTPLVQEQALAEQRAGEEGMRAEAAEQLAAEHKQQREAQEWEAAERQAMEAHTREETAKREAPLRESRSANQVRREQVALPAAEATKRAMDNRRRPAWHWLVIVGGMLGVVMMIYTLYTPPPSHTYISTRDGMVMKYVPEGEFLMGSADSDKLAKNDEKPQRTVYLDAYWIDQTEVSNAMYAECVVQGECSEPSNKSSQTRGSYYGTTQYADYPVIYVGWNQAGEYCAWAGRRLPSEAEWEKAARGTDGRIYPWDNQPPGPTLVNFSQQVGDTSATGSYLDGASLYGALDMAGNVWEWVNDWYDASYYSTSSLRNPSGPVSGDGWVLRGGSWGGYADYLRVAYRNSGIPTTRYNYIGFRCAAPPGN